MDLVLRLRGRDVTPAQLEAIRGLIENQPGISRRALSIRVCEDWGWKQPNGELCDVKCRALLLVLERGGHLQLPAPRWYAKQPAVRVRRATPPLIDERPLTCTLAEVGTIEIRQVRRTREEPLVQALLDAHHYLGYCRPVGEHLKYLVSAGERPLGCFIWSSPPRCLAPRDRYIGWSPVERRAGVHLVAYQSRFLILPWVRVPHLASHLLGAMNRRLSADWQRVYAHPIHFVETFVDPELYRGTCYKAGNWIHLGMTTGRGKNSVTSTPNRSLKEVYGYALRKDFRELLRESGKALDS